MDKNFVFSANSLQDYVDCPRRFELKYLLDQSWPALVSQPVQQVEEKMAMGSEFHRLARQYLEGLPAGSLAVSGRFPVVREWFERFTAFISPFMTTRYFAEFASYTTIEGFRVVSVFDFVASLDDRQILIADWKTTESQPRREFYQDRVQTLLYPLVAYETAPAIFGKTDELAPSHISLLYWFPAFPEKSLEFRLITEDFQRNKAYISDLLNQILTRGAGDFPKTTDTRRCNYCQYRSLCERGIEASNMEENTELDIDALIESLNFDQPSEPGK